MSGADRFFSRDTTQNHLRLSNGSDAMIRHEVLFERSLTSIRHRPLYIGTAYAKRRFLAAFMLAGTMLSALIGRAAWMQIWQGQHYEQLSAANRLRRMPLWPQRGIIRDRQGKILAENTTRFQVSVIPSDVSKERDRLDIELGEVARLLGVSIRDLEPLTHATGSARDEPVLVADQLTYPQAMAFAVASPRLPGFTLSVRPRRRYPFSSEIPSLSHVLGYVGKLSAEEYDEFRNQGYRRADEIGKNGLERSYERPLRGIVGERLSEVDAHGRESALVGSVAAEDGKDLALTLDAELQKRAERALIQGMAAAKVTRGAAVALDPRDGSVLAAVSLPAYDNNAFSGSVSSTYYRALLANADQPLFPRAWAGTYPSGSTVKIVISVAALAEKIITADTTVLSVGGIRIGPWFFPDWKAGGHGSVNVRKAIAWSVNTFFYMVGGGYESFNGLGVDRLSAWMRKFGLGAKSGVDVAGEASGFVPTKEWKETEKRDKWFVGDTYNLSIGQGDLLVTPLQVAAYTAAIANGGRKIIPHIAVNAFATSSEPLAEGSVMETVRAGMRDNVAYGSGRALSGMPFPVAGKTGTAQWHSEKNTHAWFTAFAPFERPEVVVTVLLEEGGEGSSASVPIARNILEDWWKMRGLRGGGF